jgi:hypothetical protein
MTLMARSIEKMLTDPRVWERIEKHSMPEPNTGCVLWIGHVDKDGYAKMTGPRFHYKRVAVTVSKLVLSKKLGFVCDEPALHKCDVSCCVAEEHLYNGSYAQNYADMIDRGRRVIARDNFGKYTNV